MQAASFTGIVRLCDVLIQTLEKTIAPAELIDAEESELPDVNRVGPLQGWQIWRMDPLAIHSGLRYTEFILNGTVGWIVVQWKDPRNAI
jgi:hypothetical protein